MNFGIRFQQIVLTIISVCIIASLIFYGSLPESYNLSVGSISRDDIYATRNFVDTYQTKYDAIIAKNSVESIFIRSTELSEQSNNNVEYFFVLLRQSRSLLVSDSGTVINDISDIRQDFINNCSDGLDMTVSTDDADIYLRMSFSTLNYIEDKCVAITEIVTLENLNSDQLDITLDNTISSFIEENSPYYEYLGLVDRTLESLVVPNSVFDADATDDACDNAYSAVMNNPVIVEKGTKLVSSGEVITEHSYQQLKDLELIRKSVFDVLIFLRAVLYVLLIAVITVVYIRFNLDKEFSNIRVLYTVISTFLLTIAASVYVSKISGMMALVLFFTTIAATYISTNAGIVLSLSNVLLVWPIYGFAPEFAIISTVGIIVCAVIAGRSKHKYNSAALILLPSLVCVLTSLAFSFLNALTRNEYIDNAVWSGISALLSIVAAIGCMPIYELASESVSPVKLIELSQLSHPLLQRLFKEASGTYQHSMMVANLADTAAEAIGADALLCRVAAYYHDIGKLENPMFFTENQSDGYNPHNDLPVEESVSIITSHTDSGVKLATKYKLPGSIISIINEHHGTTYPAYFYFKAKKQAEESGLPVPSIDDFRYRGSIPTTRESAIVMIADTSEAAIKSMKLTDIDEIESNIRKFIKDKISNDQLITSGLSFDDIEKIVAAFRQVYAGVNHERIQYPDGNKNKQ